LPEATRFYDHLIGEATTAFDATMAPVAAAITTLESLLARVKAKRENPFGSPPHAPMTSMGAGFAEAFDAFNAIIEKHNKTTEYFQRSVKDSCETLERSYVAEAREEYVQLAEVAKTAAYEVERLKGKSATIQGEIDTLEHDIVEHRRPARELTEDLRAYLGRDELRFDVKGSGYALTRNGQPVSHLSEGERTAIAFLYFLKSLQDKSFDMANGIVVIDDPVSSLDANALFSAFGYMKERAKQCGQLFIFTHSFSFFRLVKNWFHYLDRHSKKLKLETQPARFFLLRSRKHTDGSRTSQLGPLDRLLEEHESEYQYLFKRVYDEAHRSDIDSLEHHYELPNSARRLVEAFLAFRFPDLSGDLSLRFERVSFDNAKKTRILRLLNTYSHAGAISDPEHDLSLLAETQPVLLDVLEMMKAVDKEHYEGLENLVAAAGVAGGGR
jgi:wobble nucleotide-excising tRNase